MQRSPASGEAPGEPGETSLHLRRAVAGDAASLEWLVVRLSPILVLEARERLGPYLRKLYDAEDLVQDAWLVAIPRLGDLPERGGRLVPVVLRFLCTCILHQVNNLLRKHLGQVEETRASLVQMPETAVLVTESTDIVSRVSRHDTYRQILAVLEDLPDLERRIILLRGVEQCSTAEVGLLLSLKPNTVAVKYRRTLERLRQRLPRSVFDELEG